MTLNLEVPIWNIKIKKPNKMKILIPQEIIENKKVVEAYFGSDEAEAER